MKNYFIVHALGRTGNEYWYNFIKPTVENAGHFTKGYDQEFKEMLKYL